MAPMNPTLLPDLVANAAHRDPERMALTAGGLSVRYASLANDVLRFASGLVELGLLRGERLAVYLDKRPETVVAVFGAASAGGVFVPVNPVLKGPQVAHILRDCNARVLVTSAERFAALGEDLRECVELRHVILVERAPANIESGDADPHGAYAIHALADILATPPRKPHRVIDTDMTAI